MSDDNTVILAAVSGAHGIAGEVRLKLFAETLDSVQRQKQLWVGGRPMTLNYAKAAGSQPIARFAEISDRTAAEALRGQMVTIPRSALPALEPGEYYHADLIGLPCESRDGEALGQVVAVENFGAGDILEIERPDGKRVMVPFREDIADLQGPKLLIDPVFVV